MTPTSFLLLLLSNSYSFPTLLCLCCTYSAIHLLKHFKYITHCFPLPSICSSLCPPKLSLCDCQQKILYSPYSPSNFLLFQILSLEFLTEKQHLSCLKSFTAICRTSSIRFCYYFILQYFIQFLKNIFHSTYVPLNFYVTLSMICYYTDQID